MNYVTAATYVRDYQIRLMFNDKKSGIVDLKETVCADHRKIFRELTDLSEFKKFRVDADTIVWNNGLDLAPEFLRELLIKQNDKK